MLLFHKLGDNGSDKQKKLVGTTGFPTLRFIVCEPNDSSWPVNGNTGQNFPDYSLMNSNVTGFITTKASTISLTLLIPVFLLDLPHTQKAHFINLRVR